MQGMKRKINGNTAGVRETLLADMETLYDYRVPAGEFLPAELADKLAVYTGAINREVLVYISRAGEIVDARIGDSGTVDMTEIRLVRNIDRLAGVRCVHTHPNGDPELSDVDIGSLNALKLDAISAIGALGGRAVAVMTGYIGEMEGGRRQTILYGPTRPDRLPQQRLLDAIFEADARLLSSTYDAAGMKTERAILAGIDQNAGYDTLAELAALCDTAGIEVVGRELQRKRAPDSATYIGSGKAEEIKLTASAAEADLIVFDDELTAIQMRNLEAVLSLPIIDRTMLILDIFASRAQSREGKLQVELAQLKYRLPRLLGMGRVLSRQGASGVGMRGPGEKKLEIDRRRIKRRIYELEQELSEIDKQRELRREARTKNPVPIVSLVGYTNAGKSTLLNALSGSDALAEDKLFATLDPIVRRVRLPGGAECLVSDTVGFINKLPHDLVNAFRSTLEEVKNADLILHVIDSSSPYCDVQIRVVEDVLGSLGALDTPRVEVFNKQDAGGVFPGNRRNAVAVSALNGGGLDGLLGLIEKMLAESQVRAEFLIPYEKYDAMRLVRSLGTVLSEAHEENGTRVVALLSEDELWRVKQKL